MENMERVNMAKTTIAIWLTFAVLCGTLWFSAACCFAMCVLVRYCVVLLSAYWKSGTAADCWSPEAIVVAVGVHLTVVEFAVLHSAASCPSATLSNYPAVRRIESKLSQCSCSSFKTAEYWRSAKSRQPTTDGVKFVDRLDLW